MLLRWKKKHSYCLYLYVNVYKVHFLNCYIIRNAETMNTSPLNIHIYLDR